MKTLTVEQKPDRVPTMLKAIDRRLWQQAKAAAALEGITLSEFIERLIREAVGKSPKGGIYMRRPDKTGPADTTPA